MDRMETLVQQSLTRLFEYYKHLADEAMQQLTDEQFFWKPNDTTNSIAVIVQHMSGNLKSRFTNFLIEDGEKTWRKRDEEFEEAGIGRGALMAQWAAAWQVLFEALAAMQQADWQKTIYIRSQPHSPADAFNRQLGHYAYHVGQIVYVAKMLKAADWKGLSIPKGQSLQYNAQKIAQPEKDAHFTDECDLLSKI